MYFLSLKILYYWEIFLYNILNIWYYDINTLICIAMTQILEKILQYSIDQQASDIHICEWSPVTLRIKKHMSTLESAWNISKEAINSILHTLMNEDEVRVKSFLVQKDADFAYIFSNGSSFRVNAYMKIGKIAFSLRRIEAEAVSIEDLWLPEGVKKITKMKQGLVLITGPTGSWKSTSMISLLNEINLTRSEHIITVEDPIEFVFKNQKSLVSQREVWNDTQSFATALRSAMREDPDIIMIGEMRDRETVEAAMEMAETGHLVISTMHTSWSVQTVTRIINFFPPEIQNAVRYKLWDVLGWVLSQRLVQRADKQGITGIYELMFMTTGIKNLIREGTLNQIQSNIETGTQDGMVTMQKYAHKLEQEGIITKEAYEGFFDEVM